MNNKIIISAAGSGKTTYLVNKALSIPKESVLITTYTEANAAEIQRMCYQENGCIPSNLTIMTWFTFLLTHGVRPYQDALDSYLSNQNIGFYLTNQKSGYKYTYKGQPVFWGEKDFGKFYFSKNLKLYSDKISKFIIETNIKTSGKVFERLEKIYSNIFIDEVQDLAGYDYDLLSHLFKLHSNVILVGDPRQVTYLTHPTRKYAKYSDGNLKKFIEEEINKKETICYVDTETLNISHRNNQIICDYSSLLYPELSTPNACECCRNKSIDHQGIFLVHPNHIDTYIKEYNPIQIRWNRSTMVSNLTDSINMGESKGLTFGRTLIYPTKDMIKWIQNNKVQLKNETRAKFYVSLTRAKYSTAIVYEYDESDDFEILKKYQPGEKCD